MKTAVLRKGETTLIQRVRLAENFRLRAGGLLGAAALGEGQALYLVPCRCVHTAFMRFHLDLVFLARNLRVTRIVRDVPSFRVVWGGWKAHGVLEMEAGWFPADALKTGDEVSLVAS